MSTATLPLGLSCYFLGREKISIKRKEEKLLVDSEFSWAFFLGISSNHTLELSAILWPRYSRMEGKRSTPEGVWALSIIPWPKKEHSEHLVLKYNNL